MSAEPLASSRSHLEAIVNHRRAHRSPPPVDLEARLATAPPPRSLLRYAGSYRTFVLAECKQASPSRGLLVEHYDPPALARCYVDNGAVAVSVLTEPQFFHGALDDLEAVRDAVDVPILRKDFTLDEQDLLEARAYGADLVLLIVAILDSGELRKLVQVAAGLGMEAIVEVHDAAETQVALEAGARIIGINNRDLRTFQTDLTVTERLAPAIPSEVAVISESGITSGRQVHRLQLLGVRGVLVGEALLTAPDPSALLHELVDAGCPDCWSERIASGVTAATAAGDG